MVDLAERKYLLREGHLLGGTVTLLLEHFVHPYAVVAYLWIVAALWLWSAAHSGSSEERT